MLVDLEKGDKIDLKRLKRPTDQNVDRNDDDDKKRRKGDLQCAATQTEQCVPLGLRLDFLES